MHIRDGVVVNLQTTFESIVGSHLLYSGSFLKLNTGCHLWQIWYCCEKNGKQPFQLYTLFCHPRDAGSHPFDVAPPLRAYRTSLLPFSCHPAFTMHAIDKRWRNLASIFSGNVNMFRVILRIRQYPMVHNSYIGYNNTLTSPHTFARSYSQRIMLVRPDRTPDMVYEDEPQQQRQHITLYCTAIDSMVKLWTLPGSTVARDVDMSTICMYIVQCVL